MNTLSIVILTTGTEDRLSYLERLFASLQHQSLKPHEVMVATEIAPPRLEDLVKHYLRSYGVKCEILVTGYWNKCKTLNKAILKARGKILVLLEDDLVLTRNFLEEIIKPFTLDPRIGCVYARCIWVFREGLKHRHTVTGLLARIVSKLSVHESVLARMGRQVVSDLFEVPVFTMCVACRKEVLLKAGLWDTDVEEPILGEDYDIALRIRKAGYKIVQNRRAIALHYTRQVSKKYRKLAERPDYLRGVNRSEVYFILKNTDILGAAAILHPLYRIFESLLWSYRLRSPVVAYHGIIGVLEGIVKALKYLMYR